MRITEPRIDEQDALLAELQKKAVSSERLIAQLENDLASAVQGIAQTGNLDTMDVLKSAENATPSSPDASLVPILTAQRNRLHERVAQLEEVVSLEKTRQLAVQNEIETVRAENTRLAERCRFLQSTSSTGSNSIQNLEAGLGVNENLTHRNAKRLSMHDKTTLSIGKAILATPSSRTAFFSYLLILHLLIMLVLYKFAFDQSVVRDAETECEYKFHQHMLDNHKSG